MDKKSDIVNAAQTLFSRFGLKKVTTDDIAKEAGASKATVYKYFKNKSDIFDYVVKMESEYLLTSIKDAVVKEKTAAGKFKAHLLIKMEKISDLINFYQVTQDKSDGYWPYIEETRDWFLSEERKIIMGILDEGNKSNELHVDNVELIANMMVISLKSQELEWAYEGKDISLNDYIDTMIDVMINGIGKR
jgi:AcrR family transcriptional regulator